MKTMLFTTLALLAIAGSASAQTTPGYKTTPGYDRPGASPKHQHVVYFNDTMEHYDLDMQVAVDAYSTNDLIDKYDKRSKSQSEKQYDHKKHAKHA